MFRKTACVASFVAHASRRAASTFVSMWREFTRSPRNVETNLDAARRRRALLSYVLVLLLAADFAPAQTGLPRMPAPPVNYDNSPRVHELIRAGNLYLTLQDALALAIENNLDI